MTNMNIFLSLGELDPGIIEKAAPAENVKKVKKSVRRKWAAIAAACIVLMICALPVITGVLNGAHGEAPVSVDYASVEEIKKDTGVDTLYSKLNFDEAESVGFSVSYAAVTDGDDVKANLEKPLQLRIRAVYSDGDTTDKADYYVIFNRDSVDDSYIGGYEEQGLTKEIGGVTVHYSLIRDGAMHGQAKFVYEGNLYVIDVNTIGSDCNLDAHVDAVLK